VFAKAILIAFVALVFWTIAAHPTGAHGPRVVYRVQAYDTLWSIASSHYGGDVRDAVWRIEHANHLDGADIRPGQALVLP
jgi:nucleoid-associated protein YgaU